MNWQFRFMGQLITVEVNLLDFRIGILIDGLGFIAHPCPFVSITSEPMPSEAAE
jgi:hypothetical protein